jgi:hypothetical protein
MVMLLIIHVIFAVVCLPLILIASVVKFFGKSGAENIAKISSCSLIGLLLTGTSLVVFFHANLLSSCYAGLAYSAFFGLSFVVYKKLATSKIK